MASFEERLTTLAGPEGLKSAKAMLKSSQLVGAWRDSNARLCGCFDNGSSGYAQCSVRTGDEPECTCSVCKTQLPLCAHGAALLMYSGRFPMPKIDQELDPNYRSGMSCQAFEQLASRGLKNSARLFLHVLSDSPHAPCRREHLVLSVRMRNQDREFIGNLNNLRQLYFDKSLRVVLKFDDFSLHEQQLIRFLSLYGEAENSNIVLNSEMAAEFFHALPGFPRFYRDNRHITVHMERAEPVLISSGSKFAPGLRVNTTVLPFAGARIISGRAGSWIGKNDEYFFVGGDCENGFLRSFFRTPVHERTTPANFPLPVVKHSSHTLETLPAVTVLDLVYDRAEGNFELAYEFMYRHGERGVLHGANSSSLLIADDRFYRKDREAESSFEQSLALFGCNISDLPGRAKFRNVEHAAVFIDQVLPEFLKTHPETRMSANLAGQLSGKRGIRELNMNCRLLRQQSDSYIISFDLGSDGVTADWENCAKACAGHKKFIHEGCELFAIPENIAVFIRAAKSMLRKIDPAARTFELPFYNTAYFNSLTSGIPGAAIPELAAPLTPENIPLISNDTRNAFEFKGVLRNYQQQGVAFCQFLTDRNFNALLADEMGLGKTVQFLALLSSRLTRNSAPALIVCPASLVPNWEREANKFVPAMRVSAPQGSATRKKALEAPESFDLLILSYTAARLSARELKKINFSYLALDEAQHIKNPGSGNAKNCKNLNASHKIVLTGTPLENSPEDLWSVMDFLQPGMLGTLPEFRRRYADIAVSSELQHDLNLRTSPFIKRRTKKEVASDLPERSEHILYCDFDEKQRELYDRILAEGRENIASLAHDDKRCGAEIFATLLKLRQVCCHPQLLADNSACDITSAKSELFTELLAQSIDSGHKVLLFSQFTSMLKLLIPELERSGIPFEYLDGSTRNRQQRIDNFNNSPDIPLFLLSLKAGGTGLNLTSADTVFIYDPWWNPAAELQAADRTHRIGQTRPVSINKLVMRNSVEEKILAMQARKRELFYNLVENPSAGGGISLDELRELLN